MSLNVLHGFPRFERLSERLDGIAREIRRQDADVVCLQEVPWTRRLGSGTAYLAERTRLNHLYLRANGNRWTILFEEGAAILSRYPLRDPSFVELKPRAGLFEHRVALHAVAVTPWDEVGVFVTHLTHGDPRINRRQAGALQAFVDASVGPSASRPAIVAGDLNATEDTPQIEFLARTWIDAHRAAHPTEPGLTCCVDDLRAGPDERLEVRIDYLYVVPPPGQVIQVLEARRVLDQPLQTADGWLWTSDHAGLLAVLEIRR
jgi:endonuclease/exonuclease/phosphatase family metal-dependent hydrolase